MPVYVQAQRPLRVTTALGPDALLLTGFRGREALSELFEYELDLIAPTEQTVDFSRLLGQPAVVELEADVRKIRYFHGIINRFRQGGRDVKFTRYSATVVPALWLLTKRTQSRIFQQMTVPDILKKVLSG